MKTSSTESEKSSTTLVTEEATKKSTMISAEANYPSMQFRYNDNIVEDSDSEEEKREEGEASFDRKYYGEHDGVCLNEAKRSAKESEFDFVSVEDVDSEDDSLDSGEKLYREEDRERAKLEQMFLDESRIAIGVLASDVVDESEEQHYNWSDADDDSEISTGAFIKQVMASMKKQPTQASDYEGSNPDLSGIKVEGKSTESPPCIPNRLDSVESLPTRSDSVESLPTRLDSIESLPSRLDSIESLPNRLDSIEELDDEEVRNQGNKTAGQSTAESSKFEKSLDKDSEHADTPLDFSQRSHRSRTTNCSVGELSEDTLCQNTSEPSEFATKSNRVSGEHADTILNASQRSRTDESDRAVKNGLRMPSLQTKPGATFVRRNRPGKALHDVESEIERKSVASGRTRSEDTESEIKQKAETYSRTNSPRSLSSISTGRQRTLEEALEALSASLPESSVPGEIDVSNPTEGRDSSTTISQLDTDSTVVTATLVKDTSLRFKYEMLAERQAELEKEIEEQKSQVDCHEVDIKDLKYKTSNVVQAEVLSKSMHDNYDSEEKRKTRKAEANKSLSASAHSFHSGHSSPKKKKGVFKKLKLPFGKSSSHEDQSKGTSILHDTVSMVEDSVLDVLAIRLAQGLDIQDRTYRLVKYKKCFLASKAVDFMVEEKLVKSRADAVTMGVALQRELKFWHHVEERSRLFSDDHQFFRLTKDDDVYEDNSTDKKQSKESVDESKESPSSVVQNMQEKRPASFVAPAKCPFSHYKVSQLRALAEQNGVDISGCVERSQIVTQLTDAGVKPKKNPPRATPELAKKAQKQGSSSSVTSTTDAGVKPKKNPPRATPDPPKKAQKQSSSSSVTSTTEAMSESSTSEDPIFFTAVKKPATYKQPEKCPFEGYKISKLKAIAAKNCVDVSDCLERSQIVARLKHAGISKGSNEDVEKASASTKSIHIHQGPKVAYKQPESCPFEGCKISRLKEIAAQNGVDVSTCVERSHIVTKLKDAGISKDMLKTDRDVNKGSSTKHPQHVNQGPYEQPEKCLFEGYKISRLKEIAKENGVDVSKCVERSHIVAELKGAGISKDMLGANRDVKRGSSTKQMPPVRRESNAAYKQPEKCPFEGYKISRLKEIAKENGVDVSDCVERSHIVAKLKDAGISKGALGSNKGVDKGSNTKKVSPPVSPKASSHKTTPEVSPSLFNKPKMSFKPKEKCPFDGYTISELRELAKESGVSVSDLEQRSQIVSRLKIEGVEPKKKGLFTKMFNQANPKPAGDKPKERKKETYHIRPEKDEFSKYSISELKQLARDSGVDVSFCVERNQIADELRNAGVLRPKTTKKKNDYEGKSVSELKLLARKSGVNVSSCVEREEIIDKLKSAGVKPKDDLSKQDFSDWSTTQLQFLVSAIDADMPNANKSKLLNRVLRVGNSDKPHLKNDILVLSTLPSESVGKLRAIARRNEVDISDCREKDEILGRLIGKVRITV